jgi:hypothetical protein
MSFSQFIERVFLFVLASWRCGVRDETLKRWKTNAAAFVFCRCGNRRCAMHSQNYLKSVTSHPQRGEKVFALWRLIAKFAVRKQEKD